MNGNEEHRQAQRRARKRDVQIALAEGRSVSWLAGKWGICSSSASLFLRDHASPEDHARIADNGRVQAGQTLRGFDLGARLELIALCRKHGWTLEKIGDAIGVSAAAVCVLVKRQAPHGLDEAIEDFREEEAA